jgi:hypothetical protein
MVNANLIHPRMEIVGSDGEHVAQVENVSGSDIELARLDLTPGLAHTIPVSWVAKVDDKVHLNISKQEAKDRSGSLKH